MKTNRFRAVLLLTAVGCAVVLAGCPPPLDPALSPPVIGKPLYACAEMIAYGGADRDAKIRVYVNGTQVVEVNTWLGWGAIKLPSALKAGDVVAAAQLVGGKISAKTREPVTVVALPAGELTQGKLKTPEVVPPLYECQKLVRVRNVTEGATVVLRNQDADTWKAMTPYSVVRIGTPELRAGDWYNAMQQLCKDKVFTSNWSAKETVLPKPSTMPAAKVHEPLVAGTDACRVDELIPGAVVKISADDGSGPVAVGGGVAVEAATIFHISPVADTSFEYSATQALCDLVSTPEPGVPPVKEVPTPRVEEPLCGGEIYVTVCDTVVMSTVKVFVGTGQKGQAAGNGGCVKMALGDSTVLATGDKVTATQLVAGVSSTVSAVVTVKPDGAPPYDPTPWNTPAHQSSNNCYNYGCNIMTDTYAQPGDAHGAGLPWPFTCADVDTSAKADGLTGAPEKVCKGCVHRVALVVSPQQTTTPPTIHDYHWYRLDDTGLWSHKPGGGQATDKDASGNAIPNPETADRKYVGPDYILDYSVFCARYCVDKDVVVIQ